MSIHKNILIFPQLNIQLIPACLYSLSLCISGLHIIITVREWECGSSLTLLRYRMGLMLSLVLLDIVASLLFDLVHLLYVILWA